MICLTKNYPKISKSFNRVFICLLISLVFLLLSCGRKADPTLEDYLQPEPVEKMNLTATYDKILIIWRYPEKAKTKIESFLIERETKGQRKTLGYYDKNTTSLEDTDIIFGETYKYRIFAISPKGIYSKPAESEITPQRLSELENINYKITSEGVLLSWNTQNSFVYNIYRINQKNERVKIGSTDKNSFLDGLIFQTISSFTNASKQEIIYIITACVSSESTYMENKGTEIRVPISSFIPSKPAEVFWSINEHGVYISWKEVPERWIKDYKIYRKRTDEQNFKLIGETMIPLFFDAEYNISNLRPPVYYKITTQGPLKESEPEEIKMEVQDG